MSKIYVFSGLGADQRVFKNIDFKDLSIEYIDWIPPLENETIQAYAKRIAQKITAEHPIIIGLSFGGMLAVEIAKFLPVKKLILISSAKTKQELPKTFHTLGKLGLNKLIPKSSPLPPAFITNWFFGIKAPSDKELMKEIAEATDATFSIWAIHQIAHWENNELPKNCIHIHGNKDKVIPFKNVKADFVIKGGGHFMIVNKAQEIGEIIQSFCK